MKTIKYLMLAPILALGLSIGTTSCGDNTDFFTKHILTDEELAEMARQDSIKQAQLAAYNVDLMYEYDVEITMSTLSYDGATVYLDLAKIGEDLGGLSAEEVNKGILNMRDGGYENAPKFTGFAIEGSTHADNMTAYNTNSCWGHWWSADGDVTTWGESAYVYAEYDTDFEADPTVGWMSVGQYPGHLTEGQVVTFVECIKYQEKRIGFMFRCTAVAMAEVKGGVVGTQNLSLVTEQNDYFETVPVEFDLNKTMSDLGVSTLADVKWIAVNADGSYAQEYNADPNPGFFFDKEGYYGSYGANASIFCLFPSDDVTNTISVGQMQSQMPAGSSVTVQFGAINGDKIEMFNLTVTTTEAAAVGGAEVYTKSYTVKQALRKDYSSSLLPIEVDAITSALGISNMSEAKIVSVDSEGAYTRDYTANNGFWYNKDGGIDSWSNGLLYAEYHGDGDPESDSYAVVSIGMHSENPEVGNSATIKFGFSANDKVAMLTINYTVGAEGSADEGFAVATDYAAEIAKATTVWTKEVSVSFAASADSFDGNVVTIDHNEIVSALGISKIKRAKVFSLSDANTIVYQDGDPAYWFGASNYVTGYNDDAKVYLVYDGLDDDNLAEYPEDIDLLYVGQFPGRLQAGDTFAPLYGFYAEGKVVYYKVNITVTAAEQGSTESAAKTKRAQVAKKHIVRSVSKLKTKPATKYYAKRKASKRK